MPFWKNNTKPARSRILEEKTKRNGFRHTIFTVSGNTYRGDWRDNQKHGKGVDTKNQLYEGEWKKGKKSGYGKQTKILNNGIYILEVEGTWLNGKPEGTVRKHYSVAGDQSCKDSSETMCHGFIKPCYHSDPYYEGEMKAGKRSGHGRMWYSDGSFYDGKWKHDMRDGVGLFVEVNGNRYEGEWQVDYKHGYGEFFHLHSGQKQCGLWHRGIPTCTVMQDIQFRQACEHPTPYPIPQIELSDPDIVYLEEYNHLRSQQEKQLFPDLVTVKPKPIVCKKNLAPWFFDACCTQRFPNGS